MKTGIDSYRLTKGQNSLDKTDNPSFDPDFKFMSLGEIVQSPKYCELLNKIKYSQKTDLHAHLGGAVPLEFIHKYSSPAEYSKLVNFLDQLKGGLDYSVGFQAFSMIRNVLTTNRRLEEAAYEYCRSRFMERVAFTELRTGLKRLDGGFEDALKSILEGLKRGMSDFSVKVTLLLSLRRDTPSDDAEEIIDLALKYRGDIVKGIDVSGESTVGDGSGIFEALKRAKSHQLPITLHIGENRDEKPEQQLKELQEIQPDRVGHAVHLCPEAAGWIKDNKVIVEACLRSALSVSMIEKPGEHPAIKLFKEGHPVVFCTDDSTLFGDLSEELALVACLCGLTLKEVVNLQEKALEFAFK